MRGEACPVGTVGLRPFFLAKKKGPKKTLPQSVGEIAGRRRSRAARLGLWIPCNGMLFVIVVKMVLCFCCWFFRGLFVRLRKVHPWAILTSRASCALLDEGGDGRIGFGYGLL